MWKFLNSGSKVLLVHQISQVPQLATILKGTPMIVFCGFTNEFLWHSALLRMVARDTSYPQAYLEKRGLEIGYW
ncbi:hypothetical protein [Brunnivagina elsteri]|uniref:Uncharacterized protein n=1 Tax=Brunnivagina elsteri CCALA 953 TaxID=987040 RepID=A0A2A2TLE4_9CYAN|nr:hypothetical protein [Calothrix elsteri]PAX56969.1 hypothetical protein CK510_09890 [Calothrix elsteri CCALA 953]